MLEQYGSYVYNLALKLSGKPEKAEDLAQETFIKAWKHLVNLKEPAALKKWLHVICVNEFKMMVRKETRENIDYIGNMEALENDSDLLTDVQQIVVDEIQMSEEIVKLRNGCFLAMSRKLSLNQRITFSLIDMFGLSISEVADILDITPKAVKGLLYRARMNLDAFFEGHCNILDIKNPCSCEAWNKFYRTREGLQKAMEAKLPDYKEKGYLFDLQVREKIAYFYRQMPEQQPPQEWYQNVIALVEDLYK
nr:RNA polymerase sigma factor [Konateibacter massiliensis]